MGRNSSVKRVYVVTCESNSLPFDVGVIGYVPDKVSVRCAMSGKEWAYLPERAIAARWLEDGWGICQCGADVYESDLYCSSCGGRISNPRLPEPVVKNSENRE